MLRRRPSLSSSGFICWWCADVILTIRLEFEDGSRNARNVSGIGIDRSFFSPLSVLQPPDRGACIHVTDNIFMLVPVGTIPSTVGSYP